MSEHNHEVGKLEGQMEGVLASLARIERTQADHQKEHKDIATFIARTKTVGSAVLLGWPLMLEWLKRKAGF